MQEQRCRHRDRTCEHEVEEGEEGVSLGERTDKLSTAAGKTASQGAAATRRFRRALCRAGLWGSEGDSRKEGIYEYVLRIGCVVQRKLTQHGKVITLQ